MGGVGCLRLVSMPLEMGSKAVGEILPCRGIGEKCGNENIVLISLHFVV